MFKLIKRDYQKARLEIQDGDLAFYRANWKLTNKWIAWAGESPYCHVGMVAWWHGHLILLDTIQGKGGQCTRMSKQVEQYSGEWDIYRIVDPKYRPEDAIRKMIEVLDVPYGVQALVKAMIMATLRKIPYIKNHYQKVMPDFITMGFPYCSMSTSFAVREGGGVDLYPEKADQFTEPGDLIKDKDKIEGFCTLILEE